MCSPARKPRRLSRLQLEMRGCGGLFTCLSCLVCCMRAPSALPQGFSRGSSTYRGVTAHPSGRWESRIGIPGSKHVYLGLWESEQDAAAAYDRALVRLRGTAAACNFGLSDYRLELAEYHQMQQVRQQRHELTRSLTCGTRACVAKCMGHSWGRDACTWGRGRIGVVAGGVAPSNPLGLSCACARHARKPVTYAPTAITLLALPPPRY